jgi:hypothetical protein
MAPGGPGGQSFGITICRCSVNVLIFYKNRQQAYSYGGMSMVHEKRVWAYVCLAVFILLSGCSLNGLMRSSQIYPSSLGLDVTIEQLRQNVQFYTIYYSGPVFNPSAILFVPQGESSLELRLDEDWKEVMPGPDLNDLFWRIDMGNPSNVKLWAVVPPDDRKRSAENIMAFLYTKAYAPIKKINDNKYLLRSVPEQFNPDYHDGSSVLGRGGWSR